MKEADKYVNETTHKFKGEHPFDTCVEKFMNDSKFKATKSRTKRESAEALCAYIKSRKGGSTECPECKNTEKISEAIKAAFKELKADDIDIGAEFENMWPQGEDNLVYCTSCGWKGKQSDLDTIESDKYSEYPEAELVDLPVCPNCKKTDTVEIGEGKEASRSKKSFYLPWYCNNCWSSFEKPMQDMMGQPTCPKCGSDDIEETIGTEVESTKSKKPDFPFDVLRGTPEEKDKSKAKEKDYPHMVPENSPEGRKRKKELEKLKESKKADIDNSAPRPHSDEKDDKREPRRLNWEEFTEYYEGEAAKNQKIPLITSAAIKEALAELKEEGILAFGEPNKDKLIRVVSLIANLLSDVYEGDEIDEKVLAALRQKEDEAIALLDEVIDNISSR